MSSFRLKRKQNVSRQTSKKISQTLLVEKEFEMASKFGNKEQLRLRPGHR